MANKHGAKWITRERRLGIYLRDGLACVYCGSTIEDGAALTLDHLKPRCKGGANHSSNLVTCCQKCNSSRQERPVKKFVAAVAEYLNVEADSICKNVRNATRRKVDIQAAKELITKRGSYTKVIENGGK